MKVVYSKNDILIRLTDERWFHIVENHDELAGRTPDVLNTIAEPDIIVEGIQKELLAGKQFEDEWIVAVYKEANRMDGFVITAFTTSRIQYLLNRKVLWKKQ